MSIDDTEQAFIIYVDDRILSGVFKALESAKERGDELRELGHKVRIESRETTTTERPVQVWEYNTEHRTWMQIDGKVLKGEPDHL